MFYRDVSFDSSERWERLVTIGGTFIRECSNEPDFLEVFLQFVSRFSIPMDPEAGESTLMVFLSKVLFSSPVVSTPLLQVTFVVASSLAPSAPGDPSLPPFTLHFSLPLV